MRVSVRDNNVDQALRVLKKKLQREGVFREVKLQQRYEKPSEKKAREKAESKRRFNKVATAKAAKENGMTVPQYKAFRKKNKGQTLR